MSKTFLTDPKAADTGKQKKLTPFDYKEAVTATFMRWGVPLRPAELAVIDYRAEVNQAWHAKLTPNQLAVKMIDKVRKVYGVTDERNKKDSS